MIYILGWMVDGFLWALLHVPTDGESNSRRDEEAPDHLANQRHHRSCRPYHEQFDSLILGEARLMFPV